MKRKDQFSGVKKIISIGALAVWIVMAMACSSMNKATADKKSYQNDDVAYRKKFDATFDANEKPLRYGYHYIVTQIPEGYVVRVFNPDKKTLTEKKTYSTENLTLLHGPYESYWDDGSIRAQGMYVYGRKHGNWVESEPGKGKSVSGMYANQRKEGQWTQLDTNGMVETIYTFHDDQRHGKFFHYDATGQKVNEGIYRADTLISELFREPMIQKPYLRNCEVGIYEDVYSCTDATLRAAIYSNLKYPSVAKKMGIEGTAFIQWDILSNGQVANIRVPQGLSAEIEQECLRVFKMTDKWMPALQDGKPIRYTMSMPINFRLQK